MYKYIFKPSRFNHRQLVEAHRSDILKCQNNEPTPYSQSISFFKLLPFIIFRSSYSVRGSASKSYGDLFLLSFCLFVSAWICCFMLDTSLRQTPNAKRQTQNSNSRTRRSHCKFFKKIFHLWDGELSLYVEDVRWWCRIPDSYFSPGVKSHSLFRVDLHSLFLVDLHFKIIIKFDQVLEGLWVSKRSCVSLILKMSDCLDFRIRRR